MRPFSPMLQLPAASEPPPELGLVITTPAAQSVHDLTSEGATDWVHWGLATAGAVNSKSGATTEIGALSAVGGTATQYSGGTIRSSYTWSDGTPTASGNTKDGLYIAGQNKGFQVIAPADQTLRTLVVYLGGNQAAATVTATLSDGSATQVTSNQSDLSNPFERRAAITYRAASAGQTLTVTWIQTSTSGSANVDINAATLAEAS